MEVVLYFIMYMVGVAVGAYCTIILFRTLLIQKWKTRNIIAYYFITNILHVVITDYLIFSVILKYISMTVIYLIVIIVMFEGKTWKKVVIFVENYLMILLQELLVAQIVFVLLGFEPKNFTGYSLKRTMLHLACVIVSIILVNIFIYVHKQINLALSITKIKYILICFMSQIILGVAYEIIMFSNHLEGAMFFLIYIVISLAVDIYLLHILAQMEVKESTEQSIEAIIRQDDVAARYYAGVAENINNLANLRESYARELKNVYDIAKVEYNEATIVHIDTKDNGLVSSIMYNVKKQLDKMGCKYDIDMDIPSAIWIETADLSSLLINILDNAVEAVSLYMESNKKNRKTQYHLIAKAYTKDNKLIIRVENVKSSKQKIRQVDDKYITSKENKQIHGYGMQIIGRIVKKYNGNMKVEYTDDRFVNQITLEEC